METIKYDVSVRANALPNPDLEVNHPPYFGSYSDAFQWTLDNLKPGQSATITGICTLDTADQWRKELATFVLSMAGILRRW